MDPTIHNFAGILRIQCHPQTQTLSLHGTQTENLIPYVLGFKSEHNTSSQNLIPSLNAEPERYHPKPKPTGGLRSQQPWSFFWGAGGATDDADRSLDFWVTVAAATSQQLSQSSKTPGPSRTRTKYPLRGIPQFDVMYM